MQHTLPPSGIWSQWILMLLYEPYLFIYLLEVVWADAGKAKIRNDFK